MYEVAYVSYNADGSWTDETFFHGTKAECEKWLKANCASHFDNYRGKPIEVFTLGSKQLDIYKAN